MRKKRIRISKGTQSSQNHSIFGGKAQILRVPQSGDVWQFRMYVKQARRYVEKSLRSKEQALAEDLYIEIRNDIKKGVLIWINENKMLE